MIGSMRKSGARNRFGRMGTALVCIAALTASAEPAGVDPLTARVELGDAERFAALFRQTGGAPTAAQLQEEYLAPAGRAIEVFTPNRIRDADNLASVIAANPELYRDAIERCLPWVRRTEPDLRAVYLGFQGLLPEQPLPAISVIFGANTSGGTAQAGIQVLGLEVLCRMSPDEAAFRSLMRTFYAHETVHTFQRLDRAKLETDFLLAQTIAEGTADYLASLVTGEVPDPKRAQWASENEQFVWREFAADLAKTRNTSLPRQARYAAFRRWVSNAGSAPEGWPSELGYWVGMRIAQGYVDHADDKRAAIRELLSFDDPAAVLEQSGIRLPAL